MEAMAQTAAARTGWLLKKQADPKNKKAPIGVIGSIKNFKLHFQPVAGNIMTTTVEVQYELLQATIVLAKVEVEGRLAAGAELKIFLTE
jgi:3-hydroxymyristoyl/3-hydroxydecanoyl-(acyl carrier protein) dehydratase